MGVTTALRSEVKTRLFPLLQGTGFTIDQRYAPTSVVFRRPTGAVIHILEVQWEKYGRPRFRINFGTCAASGLRIDAKLHAAEDVLPSWTPDAGALQPRHGTSPRAWFRQDRPFIARLLGRPRLKDPAEVVDQVLGLLPELEDYWSTGQRGAHLHFWELQRSTSHHEARRM